MARGSGVQQHTGTVGRTFKPELDRPPYFPQKYASSCPAWLPRTLLPHSTSQRMVTPRDKFEFVMRVAKDFPEHWATKKRKDRRPGNLECFRVRTPQHIDLLQANTAYFDPQDRLVSEQEAEPQHRLTELHAPSDCIVTGTGQDLWVCQCQRVWQKPNCLLCPDCSSSCPLRPKEN
ncbi:hypothetical protein DER44DRAFT_816913 [Fusarium oxysporum]|nr:hypothetical protein DER44DRAFT_816913 [Fusarium oxysporum]